MSCAYLKLINDTFRKCISILFNLHALSSVNQSNANRNPCLWKKMSKPNTTRTGHHGNVQIWYSSFFLVFFFIISIPLFLHILVVCSAIPNSILCGATTLNFWFAFFALCISVSVYAFIDWIFPNIFQSLIHVPIHFFFCFHSLFTQTKVNK